MCLRCSVVLISNIDSLQKNCSAQIKSNCNLVLFKCTYSVERKNLFVIALPVGKDDKKRQTVAQSLSALDEDDLYSVLVSKLPEIW